MGKRGQLTVFMILGLVILFVAIFTFLLYSQLETKKLTLGKETVITKVFKKEGFRIYVEDCLSDELEKGLILIGKQGTLWNNQPGGRKEFSEFNGVLYQNDRVAYGITKPNYLQYQNAFPCKNDSFSEEFCQYSYPNILVKFGELKLKLDTVENDLQRYLINRTVWCVQNFTRSNISQYAKFESADVDLKLHLDDDGITVQAEYPLRFSVANEEVFHLSTFDFFYPTKFRQLVESAVVKPLEFDWKYVDFNYTKNILENPPSFSYGSDLSGSDCEVSDSKFLCQSSLFYDKYRSLSVEMQNLSLANGDDIFIFKSPFPNIIKVPGEYEFRIVRQNRPPALDYVNRSQCIADDPDNSYDYLVIPDKDGFHDINLSLFALDADEDAVAYEFESSVLVQNSLLDKENEFSVDIHSNPALFPPNTYSVTALATDGHGLQDKQDVRILVDRPIQTGLNLWLPYRINGQPYEELYNENTHYYLASIEDPIFIKTELPELSLYGNSPPEAHLIYDDQQGVENFNYGVPASGWLSFPGTLLQQDEPTLEPYKDKINQLEWNELLSKSEEEFPHFKNPAPDGKLTLTYSRNYCRNINVDSGSEVTVQVVECIPHRDPEYPNPYIPNTGYYKYKNGDSSTLDPTINPFLASHVCCDNIGNIKEGEDCFNDPTVDCYGGAFVQGESSRRGVYLEQKVWTCGNRGNICGPNSRYEIIKDPVSNKPLCGGPDYPQCSNSPDRDCQNKPIREIFVDQNGNPGFCWGENGCEKGACHTMIIDADNDPRFGTSGDFCRACRPNDAGRNYLDISDGSTGTC